MAAEELARLGAFLDALTRGGPFRAVLGFMAGRRFAPMAAGVSSPVWHQGIILP